MFRPNQAIANELKKLTTLKTNADQLHQAISKNDYTLIGHLLNTNADLFLKTNAKGTHFIHYIASLGNPKILELVFEHFKKQNPEKAIQLFLQPDLLGNTVLHYAGRFPDAVKSLMKLLGNRFSDAAKMANNDGLLPICFLNGETTAGKELQQIYLSHMLDKQVKPLSEPINTSKLIATYPEFKDKKTLLLTCIAANLARTLIQNSYTHPQNNSLESKELSTLTKNIENMRLSYEKVTHLILTEYNTAPNLAGIVLNNIVTHIKQVKLGNCFEFAVLTFRILKELDPTIQAKVFVSPEGNHSFVMPNPNRKDAIVCDAWQGEIFLEHEIPNKLKACVKVLNKYITIPMNAACHKFEVYDFLKPAQSTEELHQAEEIKLTETPDINLLQLAFAGKKPDVLQPLITACEQNEKLYQGIIRTFCKNLIDLKNPMFDEACSYLEKHQKFVKCLLATELGPMLLSKTTSPSAERRKGSSAGI